MIDPDKMIMEICLRELCSNVDPHAPPEEYLGDISSSEFIKRTKKKLEELEKLDPNCKVEYSHFDDMIYIKES